MVTAQPFQRILNLTTQPTYEADDYFVSSCNKAGYDWILSWPHWSSFCLILYGPKGSGKTHLAHIWAEKSKASFIDLNALEGANLDDLVTGSPAFIIDDLPSKFNENIILHLYNSIKQAGRFLLITAEQSPPEWNLQLPDLKSRLNSCIWTNIEAADDELLRAMLRKIFADAQVVVSDRVIDYLLRHCERSFYSMQAMAMKINSYALSMKRKITLSLVREVVALEDYEVK